MSNVSEREPQETKIGHGAWIRTGTQPLASCFLPLPCGLGLILFATAAPSAASPTFTNGASQGTVAFSELREASGLVASRNNANVLWTHNDAGDSARIFAIDTHGHKLGIYDLPGATHVDYEDIGMGPGPVTNVLYLYVGDIGDNNANRSNIQVYQIPEPAVYARQHTNPVTAGLKGVRAITLTYPDGAHNAEALFVDPWGGDLFIATKASAVSRIYTASKARLDATNAITLSYVETVTFDVVSGANISPAGTEIVFRQEDFARLWTRAPGQSVSNVLAGTPVSIPVIGRATEPNGEAIGFDDSGSGYYTLSDDATSQPLYYFARTSGDGPRAPQVVVAAGSPWKYLDNGSDQGAAWRAPGFDDSSWSNGVAQFGYGNGDEKTVVSFGANANNKHTTTYFRTTFVVSNAPCISNLTAKLVVDDGAAVFLNGAPALSFQLAADALYNTPASATQSTNLEDTWFSFLVDPHWLVNGTNTLAVEVHQAAPNSPALSFDLQLLAMASGATRFTSTAFLGDQQFEISLCGPDSSNAIVQASEDLTNWTDIGGVVLTNGVGRLTDAQATNFNQRFYRAKQ